MKVFTFHTLTEILVATFEFFSPESIWLAHDVGFDAIRLDMTSGDDYSTSIVTYDLTPFVAADVDTAFFAEWSPI